MKKFENRKALFNEILLEVYKFHMNYKEELNKLNINIKQIITQHANKLQTGVAKRTLSKYSNEDPFSDQLISNSVQQMVTYFMNKYSLISEEAEEIKNLIPQGNLEENNKDKEYLKIFKQEEQKINSNIINLTKAKNRYYTLMAKLEEQISKIEENKKKIISNNNNLSTIPKTKKEKKEEEKEKKILENQRINPYILEEIIRAKDAYLLALDTLNLTKREYLNTINSFSDKIKEYDNNENDLLNQLLEIFEKYDEKIRDKNKEVSGVILENKKGENPINIFIEKINKKYEFEEYIPQHNKIEDNDDFIILSEMHKLTGYNIEESFSDPKVKKEIKFILGLETIINDCSSVKKSGIDEMKEYLKDKVYLDKFFKRLNKARVDKELDKDKVVFDIIVDLFNYILTNLIENPDKNHDDIKNLLILSQSFYITDDKNVNKKIFFSNKITTPKEFKTTDFWIKFIEKEIENNEMIKKEYNNEKEENKEEIKENDKGEKNIEIKNDNKEEIKEENKKENEEIKEEDNKEGINKDNKEENKELKEENKENINKDNEVEHKEIKEENKEEIKKDNKEEKNEEKKEDNIEEKNEEKKEELPEEKTEENNFEGKEEKIEKVDKVENKEDDKVQNENNQINRNNQNEALMVFIGNISNLNDYLSNQSRMREIFAYFDEKFNFSEDNIKKVSDILGFNIK